MVLDIPPQVSGIINAVNVASFSINHKSVLASREYTHTTAVYTHSLLNKFVIKTLLVSEKISD